MKQTICKSRKSTQLLSKNDNPGSNQSLTSVLKPRNILPLASKSPLVKSRIKRRASGRINRAVDTYRRRFRKVDRDRLRWCYSVSITKLSAVQFPPELCIYTGSIHRVCRRRSHVIESPSAWETRKLSLPLSRTFMIKNKV